MSFNISAWSIRNPIPIIVLFLILTLGGLVSYPSLGIDENPNVDVPTVTVTVSQLGADPAELETQVTKKVEDAVAGLGNIDQINSSISDGLTTTAVTFTLGTDSNQATNDVRNAVAQIRQNLPQDANDPIIEKVDFSGGPVVTYSVSSNSRSVEELSDLVDRTISRAVLAVPGVAKVERSGGVDREIRVNLNPARLQALNLTATDVNNQIRDYNINLAGGRGEVGNQEQSVRTLGSAPSLEAFQNYQITLPEGGFVPLSSLGEVIDGAGDTRSIARINGKPAVVFAVFRSSGTVLVGVEEAVEQAIAQLRKTLPSDVQVEVVVSARADYIRESYMATIESILLGAVLAIITIWAFLKDWRATLITAIALPLSMIPTFIVFHWFGYTLNFMTLLALALVVGILVDDAIVEIENIERHQAMGKKAYHAAIDASDEIGLAVVATTFSIVAVFGPVALMTGVSGQFFRPFGVAVAGSVLFSLVVARTVTPLMAAYLLKDKPHGQEALSQDRLSYQYRRLLGWALRHRVLTLGAAIAFLVGSFMLVPYIPVGLFQNGDISLSIVKMELPPGTTMETTDSTVQRLTGVLRKDPNVATVMATEKVGSADIYVKLKPRGERNISQQEFEKHIRTVFPEIPGARLS
ncbi:MAG TPA: efflux RND transporter permease subunit, partial [Stenomitos sp.]